MAHLSDGPAPGQAAAHPAARAGVFMQYAGAAVSLALIAGVGVWGYKLLVRDATGIPVVRAMVGPMRGAPDTPGGEIALHTGLSVNAVAAMGEAAGPEERLVLAPPTTGLMDEDMQAMSMAEADELRPEFDLVEPVATHETVIAEADPAAALPETPAALRLSPGDGPLSADEVLALADLIAAGADTLGALAPETSATPEAAPQGAPEGAPGGTPEGALGGTPGATGPELIAASVPGVSRAMRPPARPSALNTSLPAAAPATAEVAATPVVVGEHEVPVGTTLVQLGAFDSPEIATVKWTEIAARFADFMEGKEPLIQQAQRGGQVFFRLRASGFADLADARRFCSALVAEDGDCIPVVVR